MRGRYESASTIGCLERTRMLIKTKWTVRYCFSFYLQIANVRIFRCNILKSRFCFIVLAVHLVKKVKPQNE